MADKLNFKDPAESALVNSKFIGRLGDDFTVGALSLQNPLSGFNIANIQKYINEISDTQGTVEGDVSRKVYTSTNFISNGDAQKICIQKFDVAIKTNLDKDAAQDIIITRNTKIINLATTIAGAGKITLNADSMHQVFRLSGDGGAVILSALVFNNQPIDGATITIEGQDDINTVKITLNDAQFGQAQFGDVTLKKYFSITYEYNAELERFVERGRKTQ